MFSNLDPDSKVWIFQSIIELNSKEQDFIRKELNFFLHEWKSHGNDLKADYILFKSHFIIISVDKFFFEASGCSLDKLFKKIQDLGLYLDKDFFQRDYIFFELLDKKMENLKIKEFKNKLNNNIINPTIIYDNSLYLLKDLNKEWKKSTIDWKSKYM
tara:strand:- start:411 stop:881 length:471 start_codon:yes stop_codon:yes gene_type:complete